MTNKGVVKEAHGDRLTVVFDRPEACGDCHNCMRGREGCAKHVAVIRGRASVGDTVEVELDENHVLAASALAYLLPLAGFLLGLLAGYWARGALPINPELTMALFAVLGTVAAYLLMRALNPHLSKGRWEMKVVGVSKPTE